MVMRTRLVTVHVQFLIVFPPRPSVSFEHGGATRSMCVRARAFWQTGMVQWMTIACRCCIATRFPVEDRTQRSVLWWLGLELGLYRDFERLLDTAYHQHVLVLSCDDCNHLMKYLSLSKMSVKERCCVPLSAKLHMADFCVSFRFPDRIFYKYLRKFNRQNWRTKTSWKT
jgi:hypothetical protein